MNRLARWIPCLALLALCGCPSASPEAAPDGKPEAGPDALRHPEAASQTAPERYVVKFETTKGTFRVEVTRAWAPHGADRVYSLVKAGYYDGCRFFRVLNDPAFMAQFGINGDPEVNAAWIEAQIPDDPVKQSNTRGMVTFAMAGPNTRTTQLFVNYTNNSNLDSMGFSPFGKVIEGMEVVDALYGGYGEGAPRGAGPRQDLAQTQGNAYLDEAFPKLDAIKQATIE